MSSGASGVSFPDRSRTSYIAGPSAMADGSMGDGTEGDDAAGDGVRPDISPLTDLARCQFFHPDRQILVSAEIRPSRTALVSSAYENGPWRLPPSKTYQCC